MVQKMHHTITDGEGGIRMSIEFVDLERDAPEPPPVDDGPPPPPPRPPWAGAVDAMSALPRRGADAARRLVDTATDLARDPLHVASLLAALPAESAATTRSLVRQLGVVDSHRSPLWSERSLDRQLETFEVSLADADTAGSPPPQAAFPASRRSEPKLTRNALTTHVRLPCESPRSSWMVGSATFTMVASRTIISWARQTTKSIAHGDVARVGATDGVVVTGSPDGVEV